jgi:poly-gamma-glutamate synthesis protein (capsule biosynthesis protein)
VTRYAGTGAVLAALLFLASACTGQGESVADKPVADEPAADRSVTEERSGGATEPPTPARPTREAEPRVVVVHTSHPSLRITRGTAERLLSGEVETWRPPAIGPLRRAPSVGAVARDPGSFAVVPLSRLDPRVRAAVVGGVDPLDSGGPDARPVTRVTVVGDIMLGRRVGAAAQAAGDPSRPLRAMQRRLAAADLTLGNLENTLSTAGPPQQGGDSFAAPRAVLDGLADSGVDAVSLANNHTGDFGQQALLETVAAVRRGPVRGFGAGGDLDAASRAFVTDVDGVRLAVLGFNAIGETPRATSTTPGALSVRMPPRTGPLNRSDLRHVTGLVRRLDQRVDVVVVLPHWGTQYTHIAEPSQRLVARRLVDAGADLVVGGHPHWVQGLEWYRGAVVAHSLGNFVFDMDFMTETQQGVTLDAVFWGDRLVAVQLDPYVIGADFSPRPVEGVLAQDILQDVWAHSTGPFRRR